MQRSLPTLVMFTVIGCLVANESSAQVVRQEIAGVTKVRRSFWGVDSPQPMGNLIPTAKIWVKPSLTSLRSFA